ncbi:hypothetical protein FDI40_gp681 [Agrobacterium phage Atu_ph07]|uniref:Uncharacterized protein n=1 Tax=Agrobacterium phage Atu_ph07 TaxID=2024264 RepID=A0A2L0V0Y1_9CAUD|nr:hypothetical protein FDI40_gp681 [Agrobacterium phage Atu_ph07]AUZ95430.1 hypothetical protein [Agrobacterium phage Atu_ph07]
MDYLNKKINEIANDINSSSANALAEYILKLTREAEDGWRWWCGCDTSNYPANVSGKTVMIVRRGNDTPIIVRSNEVPWDHYGSENDIIRYKIIDNTTL